MLLARSHWTTHITRPPCGTLPDAMMMSAKNHIASGRAALAQRSWQDARAQFEAAIAHDEHRYFDFAGMLAQLGLLQ
jgi:hypothetical protein